jgi:MurNAc alpha-1-phosphate uridylyltransferase
MSARRKPNDLTRWPVAILAGGMATRMRPMTEKIPKALVTVAGEPFLAHQLRLLHSAGLRCVVICAGYLGEMIEAGFGDGARFHMQIAYSFDGPQLLGTGGALKKALPLLGERFFVLYGDSYLPVDYSGVARAFLDGGKPALMTVFKNEDQWDTSNVEFEGDEIRSYDKTMRTAEMHYIDYGLGILSADVLRHWPTGATFELADVYKRLVTNKQLAGYKAAKRFYQIGSSDGLAELEALLRHQPDFSIP